MSKERFLNSVNLKKVDRVPSNEWIDHPKFVHKITGIDPYENTTDAVVAAIQKLGIDWYVSIPKGSHKFESGESKKDIGSGTLRFRVGIYRK